MNRNHTLSKSNTVEKGNALRDEVAELFRAAGCQVEVETLIGHKKVDVVVQTNFLGNQKKILIECKNYKNSIRSAEVTQIYNEYFPLLTLCGGNEIKIISSTDCSAAAKNYIKTNPTLSFITIDSLRNSIIDFSKYIEFRISEYTASDVSENYVDVKDENDENLMSSIIKWIEDGNSASPMAVLAGYGKGKTSLATKLAYELSVKFKINGNSRIPIYVPLAEIAGEQSIEGLLGRAFVTNGIVSGYNYFLFSRLNEAGRFVVICDGFDEMKHAITWEQFCYNFSQINRLVCGRSKVIVLGRPNALLSEDESAWVFKGVRKVGNHEIRIDGAPKYIQKVIGDLSEDVAFRLVRNYANFFAKKEKLITESELEKRIELLRVHGIDDLSKRPVHARMVGLLVADRNIEIKKFSQHDLYHTVITQTIEREVISKRVRGNFTIDQRRQFSRRLAWFMWRVIKTTNIEAAKIPESIFQGIVPHDSQNLEGEKRDLIQACFLESKGSVLFFPHKSFLEFLVAEYMIETELSGAELEFAGANANSEVLSFIEQNPKKSGIVRWDRQFSNFRGRLSVSLLKTLAS
ncbi:restriction endonuclease [Aestuariivirga sp.]|uniref:restriction endonuclease n=1 Tax=Aestuariivirga sp. TaxID=2650926 RepID=UPI0039E4E82C